MVPHAVYTVAPLRMVIAFWGEAMAAAGSAMPSGALAADTQPTQELWTIVPTVTALLRQRGDHVGIQACCHFNLLRLVSAGFPFIKGSKGAFKQGCEPATPNCLPEKSVSTLV